jgi:hypothetical protein
MMKAKLSEALDIVHELMADVEERYPIGLIRVRRLLQEAIAEYEALTVERDLDDVATLAPERPDPAA